RLALATGACEILLSHSPCEPQPYEGRGDFREGAFVHSSGQDVRQFPFSGLSVGVDLSLKAGDHFVDSANLDLPLERSPRGRAFDLVSPCLQFVELAGDRRQLLIIRDHRTTSINPLRRPSGSRVWLKNATQPDHLSGVKTPNSSAG